MAAYSGSCKAAVAYEYNTEFSRVLAERLRFFATDPAADTISRVQGELLEVRAHRGATAGAQQDTVSRPLLPLACHVLLRPAAPHRLPSHWLLAASLAPPDAHLPASPPASLAPPDACLPMRPPPQSLCSPPLFRSRVS